MPELESCEIILLALMIASEAVVSPIALDLIQVLDTAINKAAGKPLPDTSPITSPHLPSDMGIKS